MSTRANIAIFLKEEDRFKPLNFNDIRFDDVRPKLHSNNLQLNFNDVYCNENETTDNYVLEIYNHHDGYPDHLFSVLKRYYNSYEQALALILAGNTSFVGKNYTDAYAPFESYESTAPIPLKTPQLDEEYLYVFKDDEWIMMNC